MGFVATRADDLISKMPWWFLLGVMTLATVWGVFVVVDRHFAFYRNRNAMALLLESDQNVPGFLQRHVKPLGSFYTLAAVLFYVGWVVLGCVVCYFAVLTNRCT
jgi:hypothetical protein